MRSIRPDETEIVGGWQQRNGELVPDDACQRVEDLVTSGQLKEVKRSEDGWSVLYQDVNDGRYWELTYPQSELPGGGPPALVNVSEEEARARYGVSG